MKPLFRGDSIPFSIRNLNDAINANNFVKHYLTEGLVSKSLVKADYDDLKHDLEYLVAAHIGHENGTKEELIYKRSIFISLSENEQTSERFMTHDRSLKLTPITFDKAQYVMWRFIPSKLKEVRTGLYHYEYNSDPVNIVQFFNKIIQSKPVPTMGDLAVHAVIKAHQDNPTAHLAVLIDAAKFLAPHEGRDRLYKNALTNARRDQEWLLLPADPMNVGPGYTGRFVLNAELEIFKCLAEVV